MKIRLIPLTISYLFESEKIIYTLEWHLLVSAHKILAKIFQTQVLLNVASYSLINEYVTSSYP